MADERIEIELTLDNKKFKTTLQDSEKNASKSGSKAGDEFGDKFNRGFKASAGRIVATAAAIGAAIGGAIFTREAISAAIAQEESINRLNTALKSAGDFSQAASQDFQNFASSLQSVTTFGDEVILQGIALAKSFGATNEQAKLVAQAAADLSAELGIDFQSAVRNVGKTLGGFAGELGEVIPELKNLSQEQLRAGEGVKFLADRFAGAASEQIKTFGGATQQLQNVFGDLLETIGSFVTQSTTLRAVIIATTGVIGKIIERASEFRDSGAFETAIAGALQFAKSLTDFVIPAFEILGNVGTILFRSLETGFASIVSGAGTLVGFIGDIGAELGSDSDLVRNLQSFRDASQQTFRDSANSLVQAFDGAFDLSGTESIKEGIRTFEELFQAARERIIAEGKAASSQGRSPAEAALGLDANSIKQIESKVKQLEQTVTGSLGGELTRLRQEQETRLGIIREALNNELIERERFNELKELIDQDFRRRQLEFEANNIIQDEERLLENRDRRIQLEEELREQDLISLQEFEARKNAIIKQSEERRNAISKKNAINLNATVARGVSNTIQALTKSLINGENAFKAFGGAILNTLGDLAIQTGQFFIAQGIAIEALKAVSPGGAAIAAGAALVALGTILKSFGGGDLTGDSGGASAGASQQSPNDIFTDVASEEERQVPNQVVNFTVQGDVFDSEDTGRRIANLLNSSFETEGTTLIQEV